MNIGQNFSDSHARAQALIAKERVEGLAGSEQAWLADHLRECTPCGADATATQQALRSLRTVRVPVPRDMAARTQFRVRLRAQQLFAREPRWRLIYMMCGASWVAGAATAPYIWRGLEWIGHRAGLPDFVWKMGFGVWWALPAIVAAAILLMENAGERSAADDLKDAA
ncbi:MAG TPA: hypothetical protein VGG58_05770 [Candidatus Acidoferrum sp.]|jgi:hypothetical protein